MNVRSIRIKFYSSLISVSYFLIKGADQGDGGTGGIGIVKIASSKNSKTRDPI